MFSYASRMESWAQAMPCFYGYCNHEVSMHGTSIQAMKGYIVVAVFLTESSIDIKTSIVRSRNLLFSINIHHCLIMTTKTALIMRATGVQGKGAIKHLLGAGWNVRALVADASSDRALALRLMGDTISRQLENPIIYQGSLGRLSSSIV